MYIWTVVFFLSNCSYRLVNVQFSPSVRNQIYDVITNKEKIMDEWVNSKNSENSKRVKTPLFEQNDRKLYEWFISVLSKIVGPILQTEANTYIYSWNFIFFLPFHGGKLFITETFFDPKLFHYKEVLLYYIIVSITIISVSQLPPVHFGVSR